MRTPAIVILAVVAWLAGPVPAGAAERHSGTVAAIDPAARTVMIDELVEEGKPRRLEVHVPAGAKLALSERTLDQLSPDRLGAFVDRPIQFSELRRGDFVVVEGAPRGRALNADSLTVTLRQGNP